MVRKGRRVGGEGMRDEKGTVQVNSKARQLFYN